MALLGTLHSPATGTSARRFKCRFRALLTGIAFLLCALPAAAQVSHEYQIKAVFLFNFAQFTEWPAEAFADAHSPLIIGVLGKDPFGASLDETVRGEKVNGRPLIVQRYKRVQDIQTCHVLYISDSEAKHFREILASLQSRSILTVSDIDDFAYLGGMVQFFTKNNKIQLRINLEAVKAAKLTISSKILRSAEIVPFANK